MGSRGRCGKQREGNWVLGLEPPQTHQGAFPTHAPGSRQKPGNHRCSGDKVKMLETGLRLSRIQPPLSTERMVIARQMSVSSGEIINMMGSAIWGGINRQKVHLNENNLLLFLLLRWAHHFSHVKTKPTQCEFGTSPGPRPSKALQIAGRIGPRHCRFMSSSSSSSSIPLLPSELFLWWLLWSTDTFLLLEVLTLHPLLSTP